MKNTKIVSIVIVCLGLFIIFGNSCFGNSEKSDIVVKNNIKYHFSGQKVEFSATDFQYSTPEEYISTHYGCDNALITYEVTIAKYIVLCQGHGAGPFGNGFDSSVIPTGDDVEEIKTPIGKVANTVILILQVFTVGGIIVTGIRYMFATGDVKSEIKKTLPFLIIGIIIVFAGPAVIEFITQVFSEII